MAVGEILAKWPRKCNVKLGLQEENLVDDYALSTKISNINRAICIVAKILISIDFTLTCCYY